MLKILMLHIYFLVWNAINFHNWKSSPENKIYKKKLGTSLRVFKIFESGNLHELERLRTTARFLSFRFYYFFKVFDLHNSKI